MGGVCVDMGLLCLNGHTRRVWVRQRCVFAWKERWVCVWEAFDFSSVNVPWKANEEVM